MLGLWMYWQRPSTDEVVTITGSAKESVTANLATYNLTFDASYPVSMGLQKIIEDFDKKTWALVGAIRYRGIPAENIKSGEVSIRKNYEIIGYSENTQNIISYTLSRSISAETQDLVQADKLSKEMNAAAARTDIALSNSYTNYQYTDLESLRPQLLKRATEDAKVKAESMASSTGRKVGNLRAGRMGVVQVLAKNSIEISDYGSYDLSSPEKDIFVTVNVTFALK